MVQGVLKGLVETYAGQVLKHKPDIKASEDVVDACKDDVPS